MRRAFGLKFDRLRNQDRTCEHRFSNNRRAVHSRGPQCWFCHLLVHIYSQVTVLGTPAEEAFGGKIDLIDAGAFSDVDIAMMAHPAPEDDSTPIMIARERYALIILQFKMYTVSTCLC